MRNFQTLDYVNASAETGILTLMTDADELAGQPKLAMRREGEYLAMSASYGPLEVALRLRAVEFMRALRHLVPIEGLHASRQVGTAQAFVALGLYADGTLIMRPTIVADATGFFCINLQLTDAARQGLMTWLD